MIKQIGLPLRGRPILLITRMITDRIGLHLVLLPLLIIIIIITISTVTGSIFFPATRQSLKFKVPRRGQRSKRRFLIESEFAFFQTFSRLS